MTLFVDKKTITEVYEDKSDGTKYEFEFKKSKWSEELDIQNEITRMSTDGTFSIDMKEGSLRVALLRIAKITDLQTDKEIEVTLENLMEFTGEVGNWIESKIGGSPFRKKERSDKD